MAIAGVCEEYSLNIVNKDNFLRMCFDSITSLITHKRHYCKLRFTCKCEADTEDRLDNCRVPDVVTCSTCGQDFDDPWDLMEHVQVRNFDRIKSMKT